MAAANQLSSEQCAEYLRHIPTVWVAVAWGGAPQLLPAPFEWRPGASTIRVPRLVAEQLPRDGCVAAICADEGRWFFDLRGVHLKGVLQFVEADGDEAVYHFAEERMRGWDSRQFAGVEPALGSDPPLSRAQEEQGDILRIATLSAAGRPHITPIWYAHRDARYFAQTAQGALLVRNCTACPTVAAVITHRNSAPGAPVTYIMGRARFSRARRDTLPARLAIGGYYFASPGAVAHAFRFRRGIRRIPAHLGRRPNAGVVIIEADTISEVRNAKDIARAWLPMPHLTSPA